MLNTVACYNSINASCINASFSSACNTDMLYKWFHQAVVSFWECQSIGLMGHFKVLACIVKEERVTVLQAAFGAVDTYLRLADKGPLEEQSLEEEEAMLASLSLGERKKHKLKKKKVCHRLFTSKVCDVNNTCCCRRETRRCLDWVK